MTTMNDDERVLTTYSDIVDEWDGIILPPITIKQAVPIFAKLIKKFGRQEGRISMSVPHWSRKGRRVWANPKAQDTSKASNGGLNGLGRLVHDASHEVFQWRHPKKLTHSHLHAELEREMVAHLLRKGWHLPKVKKVKVKAAPTREQRLAHSRLLLRKWMTKKKRAETAIKKLERQQRGLVRAMQMEAAA